MTHTHTHAPTRVRSNVLMYVRTYSVLGQREQFFRSFLPLFSPFSPFGRTAPSKPFSVPHLKSSLKSKIHRHPSPPPPPRHHRRPFSTVPTHRWPPKIPNFPFCPQPTRNLFHRKSLDFFSLFVQIKGHKSTLGLCPLILCCVFIDCRGVGLIFQKGC
jgi:hypothetical protein